MTPNALDSQSPRIRLLRYGIREQPEGEFQDESAPRRLQRRRMQSSEILSERVAGQRGNPRGRVPETPRSLAPCTALPLSHKRALQRSSLGGEREMLRALRRPRADPERS